MSRHPYQHITDPATLIRHMRDEHGAVVPARSASTAFDEIRPLAVRHLHKHQRAASCATELMLMADLALTLCTIASLWIRGSWLVPVWVWAVLGAANLAVVWLLRATPRSRA